jgi:hypothetical protein
MQRRQATLRAVKPVAFANQYLKKPILKGFAVAKNVVHNSLQIAFDEIHYFRNNFLRKLCQTKESIHAAFPERDFSIHYYFLQYCCRTATAEQQNTTQKRFDA